MHRRVRAAMAGSGACSYSASLKLSAWCVRDMATPSSLSYHEQSYPEGIHQLQSQTAYLLPLNEGKAVLSLKVVREWGFVPRVKLQSHTEAG